MILETLIAGVALFATIRRAAIAYEYRYELEERKYRETLKRHDVQVEREQKQTEKLLGAIGTAKVAPVIEQHGSYV